MTTSLHLRLPPALHEQIKAAAADQGVSLNAMIVALLAGGVGFKLDNNQKRGRGAVTPARMAHTGDSPPGHAAA